MSLTPMRNPNRYDDADHSWNNSLAGVRTTHPRPVCLVALTPRAWDVVVDAVRNHAENASADDTGGDSGGQPAADLLPVEPVAHPSDLLAAASRAASSRAAARRASSRAGSRSCWPFAQRSP